MLSARLLANCEARIQWPRGTSNELRLVGSQPRNRVGDVLGLQHLYRQRILHRGQGRIACLEELRHRVIEHHAGGDTGRVDRVDSNRVLGKGIGPDLHESHHAPLRRRVGLSARPIAGHTLQARGGTCLLYTSDAADE